MNNSSENTVSSKNGKSGKKLLLFIVIGIAIIIIISVVSFVYSSLSTDKMINEMLLEPKAEAILKLNARETEELTSYKLLDAEKGIYRIPIDSAMILLVDEMSN